jgi:hypothetical protein
MSPTNVLGIGLVSQHIIDCDTNQETATDRIDGRDGQRQ